MFELASTPQDLGDIILQGLQLGRLAYRRLFMLTSIMAFLWLIPTMVQVWGVHDEVPFDFQTWDAWSQQFTPSYDLVAFGTVVLSLLVQTIFLRRIAAAAHGQTGPLQAELQQALKVWPWMVLTIIVYFIAMLVGLILLLVPGLILAVSLMFSPFGVVLEGQKPLEALNTSHHRVWGQWWRTLGMLVLVYLPILLLMAIVASLLGIGASGLGDVPLRGRDIFSEAVLEMVFLAVFSPFIYSIQYLYYHDLKLRKAAA